MVKMIIIYVLVALLWVVIASACLATLYMLWRCTHLLYIKMRGRGPNVFLSGPVTSIQPYEQETSVLIASDRFGHMQQYLEDDPHNKYNKIYNPTEMCPPYWSWGRAMIRCLSRLLFVANEAIFTPDWSSSRGSSVEMNACRWFGIRYRVLDKDEYDTMLGWPPDTLPPHLDEDFTAKAMYENEQ